MDTPSRPQPRFRSVLTLALFAVGLLSGAGCSRNEQASTSRTAPPAPSHPAEPAPASAAADQGTFVPDPNETAPDLLASYREARGLIVSGRSEEAEAALRKAIESHPESRHLRQLHVDLLWERSQGGKDRSLLEQSAREAVRAAEIGLRNGSGAIEPALSHRLAETLGLLGARQELDRIFSRLMAAGTPEPTVFLDYAQGLARLNDPRTEEALKKALPRADGDARAAYAEWLLDQGRDRDALVLLPEETSLYYLHFLRGLALERLGRTEEASAEYARFAKYSATFPAPVRFKIPGSRTQAASGIQFAREK